MDEDDEHFYVDTSNALIGDQRFQIYCDGEKFGEAEKGGDSWRYRFPDGETEWFNSLDDAEGFAGYHYGSRRLKAKFLRC